MNGQKKQFIGICVLVVLCVAAYFGLKTYNAKTAEKEQKEADSKKIEAVSIDTEKVKSFSYQLNGATITFEKDGDTWYYQSDQSINIDEDKVSTMLAAVAEVTAEEKLENVEDISEYGFDNPTNVLTFTMEDGTRTITIGMQNEITSQYYIMDNNSNAIYIVDSSISTAFSKSIEDMTVVEDTSSDTDEDNSGDTSGDTSVDTSTNTSDDTSSDTNGDASTDSMGE